MKLLYVIPVILLPLLPPPLAAEDGYRLWLRNDPAAEQNRLAEYRAMITGIHAPAKAGVTAELARRELQAGLSGLLDRSVESSQDGSLWLGTPETHAGIRGLKLKALEGLGREGYVLARRGSGLVLAANDEIGLLYGAFHLTPAWPSSSPSTDGPGPTGRGVPSTTWNTTNP